MDEAELVEYFDPDKGAYQISEKGKQYLAGELDADALEQPGDSDS